MILNIFNPALVGVLLITLTIFDAFTPLKLKFIALSLFLSAMANLTLALQYVTGVEA
ncbi:hypothetical protein QBC45DRAFT_405691 [Copromyces sp. CBS 386.78]|nr:hypothetical protein QBC45DRAFT_405691 [Copromyces sp. CBS 386.78]